MERECDRTLLPGACILLAPMAREPLSDQQGVLRRTRIAQGWPRVWPAKAWAKFGPLLGILNQNAGPRRTIRTSPVEITHVSFCGARSCSCSPRGSPLCRNSTSPVWARPGRLSALTVSHSKSVLYDTFVWVRRALNGPVRRFPAPAVNKKCYTSRRGPCCHFASLCSFLYRPMTIID